mmetsp:Transcript_37791/g.61243  ORF Transcript_37791/g.61243 Transcript_37791/m.61243 type:complete len:591 (+) Transcript_37791:68-1840(+)
MPPSKECFCPSMALALSSRVVHTSVMMKRIAICRRSVVALQTSRSSFVTTQSLQKHFFSGATSLQSVCRRDLSYYRSLIPPQTSSSLVEESPAPDLEKAIAAENSSNGSVSSRSKVRQVLRQGEIGQSVTVKGWVRTVRDQKSFSFIEVNDGSCLASIQVVALADRIPNYASILEVLSTGSSVIVHGVLVESKGKGQRVEIQADSIEVVGTCPPEYPLQKKRHSLEFLRSMAHLRPRTNMFGAVMRMRNTLAYAVHEFFQSRGFVYVHTPIITASDCEGAGAMFGVTTLVPLPAEEASTNGKKDIPRTEDGKVDYEKDFFGKPAFLTVSGQLNAEMYACALSDVYTFGPTFRAENSNTPRHLAEFWMIEPEMAFADLSADADVAEAFIKFAVKRVLEKDAEDLQLLDAFVEKGLVKRLTDLVEKPFVRLSYTEGVDILLARKVGPKDKPFEFPVSWGADLQAEHERYLCEVAFNGSPVILMNYPKDIKAFYMRLNEDGKTVAAMDILVPRIGELVGGSQREERPEVLKQRMVEVNLNPEDYEAYLDLRRYGSVPHAGFGVGFERLVQCATGMENIRDVIPFPRTPGHAEF